MAVHSILPPDLTAAVDDVLSAAGITHVAHGDGDPVGAAEQAAGDPQARAVIGPFRSADVNEALAATAPARLPLLAAGGDLGRRHPRRRAGLRRRSRSTTARCSGSSRATWSSPSGSRSG